MWHLQWNSGKDPERGCHTTLRLHCMFLNPHITTLKWVRYQYFVQFFQMEGLRCFSKMSYPNLWKPSHTFAKLCIYFENHINKQSINSGYGLDNSCTTCSYWFQNYFRLVSWILQIEFRWVKKTIAKIMCITMFFSKISPHLAEWVGVWCMLIMIHD